MFVQLFVLAKQSKVNGRMKCLFERIDHSFRVVVIQTPWARKTVTVFKQTTDVNLGEPEIVLLNQGADYLRSSLKFDQVRHQVVGPVRGVLNDFALYGGC